MPCGIKSTVHVLQRACFRSPNTAGVGSLVPMLLHNIPTRMGLPMLRLWDSSLTPTFCLSVIAVFSVFNPSLTGSLPSVCKHVQGYPMAMKGNKRKETVQPSCPTTVLALSSLSQYYLLKEEPVCPPFPHFSFFFAPYHITILFGSLLPWNTLRWLLLLWCLWSLCFLKWSSFHSLVASPGTVSSSPSSLVSLSFYLLFNTPWFQLLPLIVMPVMIRSILRATFVSRSRVHLIACWSSLQWSWLHSVTTWLCLYWNVCPYIDSLSFQLIQSSKQSGLYKSPAQPPVSSRFQMSSFTRWPRCSWDNVSSAYRRGQESLDGYAPYWSYGSPWQGLPSFTSNPFFSP